MKNFQWMLQGTTYTFDMIIFHVGKYDVVLGVLWMITLGPLTLDFADLTISFNYEGKHYVVNGDPPKCKEAGTNAKNRLIGDKIQIFMLQINSNNYQRGENCQFYTLQLPKPTDTPENLSQLLLTYKYLFVEPTTLPPTKGTFDHKIPLQSDSKAVNIRPYRYSAMKKDIIERLIKDK